MNFSIEGIDNVVDKLTQYATGDKIRHQCHSKTGCAVFTISAISDFRSDAASW